MSDVHATHAAVAIERAGFWRRAWAFIVDTVIIALVLEALAVAAYRTSHGRIQTSEGFYITRCERLNALPPGLVVSAFTPTFALHCTYSLFGMPVWNALVVGRETQQGPAVATLTVSLMLDADNNPTRGLYLEHFALLLLVLLRWGLDVATRGTVGRMMSHVRLRAAAESDIDRRGRAAITLRYVWFALPFMPVNVALLYMDIFPGNLLADPWTQLYVLGATGAIAIIATVIAIVQIVQRRDAFYDRWAGTAVQLEPDTLRGSRTGRSRTAGPAASSPAAGPA
jgi:hypothetical protein